MKQWLFKVMSVVMLLPWLSLPASAEELQELTFVLDYTPNTNHTGLYVAAEKGYFEEEGLAVNIMMPPEDGAPVLVASGSAQLGMDYQDSLASTYAQSTPLPVTNIAAVIQHNTSGIISPKNREIISPKDMEGKRYASWGSMVEQAIIKNVVQSDGGDPNKVEMVNNTQASITNLDQSDIDAIWVFYAWDGIAAQVKDIPVNYFPFIDYNDTFDYYTPTIIANNAFLKDNPEVVKAFLRAVKKGYEFAMEHPEEAAQILVEAHPELDQDIVTESQKYLADKYVADAPKWGYIDAERWDRFYTWLAEEGLIAQEIPKGYGFTNDYLPE
ncbi:ABC transporter substrate-binding protein [Dolosicoccus paucivorans]|uniref:Nitrate ABC transporter substrate-binding protein n=1 Tax=Dolosicoccus paucivorans TaxID=84521 RepID=A0A1G8LW08_9LACT|nr:ABC transporter substrate-binding protein [Dolosicoccus paucivorans]PMB84203.1 nitrate ABC transporter substrate-binding protein [Dolosicoccus paucivorans]PMC58666.1 nitrate ABC transporter substrate-binding protein [Dolosicoccus paucivorans]SDI59848.1 ABC-type nitrate/sulfonate/bicarbonate transport system, substrate-binding protein [Dolosicoccus paucivorans]